MSSLGSPSRASSWSFSIVSFSLFHLVPYQWGKTGSGERSWIVYVKHKQAFHTAKIQELKSCTKRALRKTRSDEIKVMMVNHIVVVLAGDGGKDEWVVMVMVKNWVLMLVIVLQNGMIPKREMFENSPFFCQ